MWSIWVFLCTFGCLMASGAFANVVLMGNTITLSFKDIAANFARPVKGSGEHGTLFLASPLDACLPLTNTSSGDSVNSRYVLIVRGGCGFEDKVRRAQAAGFKAAIVYNNEDSDLVAMAGDSAGIRIHAVFVSQEAGLKLGKYVGVTEIQVWLIQNDQNSAWSIMAISFLSLLALAAVVATCFFVRRHHIRRGRPRASRVRGFNGMSSRLVNAMPTLIFTAALEDNCTSSTCAICLDDYSVGDKLRILPCTHKFHTICVDAWLTSWRTFCPVCKRDASSSSSIIGDPPASERTPLLSSTQLPPSPSSSSSSSSSSGPMQIGRSSPSASYIRPQSFQGFHESLYPLTRNASSSTNSMALTSIYMSYYSTHQQPRSVRQPPPAATIINLHSL